MNEVFRGMSPTWNGKRPPPASPHRRLNPASTLSGEGGGERVGAGASGGSDGTPAQRGLNGPSPAVSANALCGLAFTVPPPPPYKS